MSQSAYFNLTSQAQAYADRTSTSSPLRQFFNWSRKVLGLFVQNPQAIPVEVDPHSSVTVFNGTRSTQVDFTTVFQVSRNPITGLYRVTSTGGTAPDFRTPRTLNPVGATLTFSVNGNGTATLGSSASTFTAVKTGDTLFIPGASTGDSTGPFSPSNEGFWIVSYATATSLVLSRFADQYFSGAAEVQTGTSGCLQAFSTAGVQVGDTVDLTSGFAVSTTCTVAKVAAQWIEVSSSVPLPTQSGIIPSATGFVIYSATKSFIRIEVDQEAAIQFNGASGSYCRVSPVPTAADSFGWIEKYGPTWSLTIVNRSAVPLTATVFSAE